MRLALSGASLAAALAAAGCGGSDPPTSRPAAATTKTASCTPTPGESVRVDLAPEGTPSRVRLGPGMELRRTRATLTAARRGEPLLVRGSVRSEDCAPLAGATVRVWQTNGDGRYGPGEGSDLRCCYLQGTVRTGADGRYALRTVRPGAYGDASPHIHVEAGHPGAGGVGTELSFEQGETGRVATLDLVLPRP